MVDFRGIMHSKLSFEKCFLSAPQPILLKQLSFFAPTDGHMFVVYLTARYTLFLYDISGRRLKRKFVPPRLPHVRHVVPLLPCGSLQLSCRHAPQGDHWDSRQRRWQGMEQRWTAEGGSSVAHSRKFTGLDTRQENGTEGRNASYVTSK